MKDQDSNESKGNKEVNNKEKDTPPPPPINFKINNTTKEENNNILQQSAEKRRCQSFKEQKEEEKSGDEPTKRRDSLWMSMGIHRTEEARQSIRKRRLSRNRESLEIGGNTNITNMITNPQSTALTVDEMANLAPGTRIMFLLGEQSEAPAVFTEMGELWRSGDVEEWRETARWVKFEEDVEEGGNRWSKPHVATLSLHALFQLRSCLLHGIILIDSEAESMPELIEHILDEFVAKNDLQESEKMAVRYVLSRRHTHQYEQARHSGGSSNGASSSQGSFLNAVRSISDIGRSFSHGKNLHQKGQEENLQGGGDSTTQSPITKKPQFGPQLDLPKVGSLPKDIQKEGSQNSEFFGRNTHFMKKLPPGVEASNVLVEFLSHHITAFVRLKKAQLLGDLTEVPVPTRFLFLLLGPSGHAAQFKEIGRAIATLMSDEIFHEVAYKAKQRSDLLDGVDEFLDAVTVLPPGEWDPSIRIEPPSTIPNQQSRIQQKPSAISDKFVCNKLSGTSTGDPTTGLPGGSNGKDLGGIGGSKLALANGKKTSLEEEDGHGQDPGLRRTGKLFGGLMLDIRRKAPHYLSDFTDALNLQCIATTCFMYFALLAPIVTFGGLLEEATHQRMAAMENLASGAICGIIYHLFSGQPLTIIGSTGPVLVFETIAFDICNSLSIDYLSFRFWIHVWTALIIFIMVATDASSLVSYITRFTEESFAMLIAVIFIYEACMKLFMIKDQLDVISYIPPNEPIPVGEECHCISTGAPFAKVQALAAKRHFTLLPTNNSSGQMEIDYSLIPLGKCKQLLGQLEGSTCYILHDKLLMSIVLMIGTFFMAITLKRMRNSRYFPTKVRQILCDFAVMIAIICMTLLDIFVGINTPKLNVPSTFRPTWSGRGWFVPPFGSNPFWTILFAILPALLACVLIFMDQQITTVIVNRRENKLKKGCGYHLDLLVLSILIIIVGALGLPIYVAATVLSMNHVNSLRVESESRAPGEVAQFVGCREQRLTGICTFLLIGLSVTMTKLLSHIPMPVLYGVFLYMGISALGGIQLFDRFLLMLVVMVAVRKLMERCFSEKDLKYLDDKMPEFHLRRTEDKQKRESHGGQTIDIDLDENQGTIRAVKTEAHLHIPMTSGNVIKIPLAAIQEPTPPSHNINISEAVCQTGMWRSIASESKSSLQKIGKDGEVRDSKSPNPKREQGSSGPITKSPSPMTATVHCERKETGSPRLATPEEDDDQAITITVGNTAVNASNSEQQPLLQQRAGKGKDKQQHLMGSPV
uniref:Anion exchange protein n=1 Tax=Meloidogyne floridensis TaxID=298350 RepID=A0A915P492_9BILA